MAKVYLTDEHYFMCSGGLFPARIYDGKSTHVSKTGKHYLTHYDTATKTPDFTCRWAVVLAVMAAVFFALLASNPIGWAILAGLIIGLGTGFLLCGVMMASGRKWIGYERHLIIKRTQYALTSDSYMVCPLGGKISWSPEITSPGIALWTGLRNTGFATFQGIMYGYAAYGGVSLFTTSGWEAVLPNLIKGWAKTYGKAGLLVRSGFAAENVAYRNATRQYEGGEPTDMLKDAGKTFIGDVYQYYNIGTKLANGEKVGAEEFANGVATPLGMVGLNIQANKLSEQQIPENLRNFSKEASNKIGSLFKRGNKVFSLTMLPGETLGDFCERVIKEYLKSQGFDKFYEVQNRSGNGVDIIAEKTKTHEVKIIEVKGTQSESKWNEGQSKELPLSKDQKAGGKTYSESRLNRAKNGDDGWKNEPETQANAEDAIDAIERAKKKGTISYEKYDVYVDEQGAIRSGEQGVQKRPW